MARDTGGNIAIDFVWGNMPMQPNDDRGSDTLNASLDNHIIASTQYNGYPGYTPVTPYLDTVANVAVPDVVGDATADATTAIEAAGLVVSASTTATDATAENDGTVKSQSPAAGTTVNVGTTVAIVSYAYSA